MRNCAKCGAALAPLFSTWVCSVECELPKQSGEAITPLERGWIVAPKGPRDIDEIYRVFRSLIIAERYHPTLWKPGLGLYEVQFLQTSGKWEGVFWWSKKLRITYHSLSAETCALTGGARL